LVEEKNAAISVSEKQLNDPNYNFVDVIYNLLQDANRQKELGANLAAMIVPEAARKIAIILSEVAQ
jgi:UDP-N-acetylglucosamine:LPS N-acetylglucosamine transferase